VETQLGRFVALHERAEPLKFAYPIILLPDLFCRSRHLATMLGYLASIGWEGYAPELSPTDDGATGLIADCDDFIERVSEVVAAVANDTILIGHGIGGTISLRMAGFPGVKAAVAIAPMLPGLRSRLLGRVGCAVAHWTGRRLKPPKGKLLFEMIADADPFQREQILKGLQSERPSLPLQVMHSAADFVAPKPSTHRLIVCGDSDRFAPIDQVGEFATSIGAELKAITGRGHWLIGGRALERTINETHRFLVRSLGQDLLLLLREEWKTETD
jgi:predicted alpha/beta hydrolase family esterase